MGLVINRKQKEAFDLKMDGEIISITVVQTRKGACRLLIEAPEKCKIIRQELEDHAIKYALAGASRPSQPIR